MKDHKLAAIVFTDIVGYTRRMEADEEGTMKLLARQRELLFPMVKEFGGEVMKEIGDGLLMMFTSANRAVRFAIAAQEKLKDEELTIRAGIHIGDVIFEEGDVFGSAVNIAARIEPLAPAGGICISEDVRSQIRNQTDINTVSIGKKDLKGVNSAVEIYQIVEEFGIGSRERIPFFKDMWKRRVIQILGLYLISAFMIKLVVGYMAKEYMLSPHLTNFVWYILISLLPSILLVSYYHGRRDTSRWTKVELIGLPVNILAATLMLVFVFQGKDLGAITTKMTLENEDGEKIEKVIVKNEFRKKILIFSFQNISEDTALDYLQYSIPPMLEYDLSQDLLITPGNTMSSFQKMAEAGYEDGTGLPITLMKRFAAEKYMNYFMFGDLNKENGIYRAYVKVYDTKLTREIAEIIVEDKSIFKLVDKLSIEVKKALGLPESHISETIDLPVSEIFTNSEKALYYFTMAGKEAIFYNWDENVRYLDLALKEDPGFALAFVTITISYFNTNNFEAAQGALESAIDLLYKLPERQQFIVKYINYVLDQEPEKALATVKMWADLYPDDINAHSTLAQRYAIRNMYTEAIHEFNEILRLDPERYQVLETLADYYMQLGNYDSALINYQLYADKLPQEMGSYKNLGTFYMQTGNIEKARENYNKAMLLANASEELTIKNDLANLSLFSLDFDHALEQYLDALNIAKSARDSAKVYGGLEKLYITRGQTARSLEAYEQKLACYESILPPKDLMVFRVFNMEPYIHAGELDKAFKILEEIAAKLEPPLDNVVPFGYLLIYAETGEVEKAEAAITGAEDLIKDFGEEMLLANIYYAQAKLSQLKEEYSQAIDYYRECLKMNASLYPLHTRISECYRNMDDIQNAEKEVLISMTHIPYDPVSNYEAALIYFEKGDDRKAMEFLERAVDIWKDAEDDYEKANIAKEKLNEMNPI